MDVNEYLSQKTGAPAPKLSDIIDPKLNLSLDKLMNGYYSDSGRAASSPAERIDSLIGAPIRAGLSSLQDGNFAGAPSAMWSQFNADPKTKPAPSGEDLVRRAGVENPYLAKGLGFGLEVATDPMAYLGDKIPIPGVTGEIVDASKMFAKKNPPGARKALDAAIELERQGPEAMAKASAGPSMADSWAARFSDRPDMIEAAKKASSSPNPYLRQAETGVKSQPVAIPNFDFKAGKEIGAPMIQHQGSPTTDSIDPFHWADNKFQVTKNALKNSDHPVTINTSSDLVATNDYIDAIPKGSHVNMYMLSDDPEINRMLFPGNPSQLRLEKAADKLKESGVSVRKIYPTPDEIIDRANAQNVVGSKALEFGNANNNAGNYLERRTGMSEAELRSLLQEKTKPRLTSIKGNK